MSKSDKSIQVDEIERPSISEEISSYIEKKQKLNEFLEKMNDLTKAVENTIKENEEDLRVANELKKNRLDRQMYQQRNLDLQEETKYMKEYLNLKEERDNLEIQIYELDMRKKHRFNILESKYYLPPTQQFNTSYNIPQPQPQLPPQNQIQSHPQSQLPPQPNEVIRQEQQPINPPSNSQPPPPPPPPPVNNSQPSISQPLKKQVKVIPKPTNINDELRMKLESKFKNAIPNDI